MGRLRPYALPALVAAVALINGLPTLRGGFVGGDDHRLVLNHVLVNHPSIEHALQLFSIFHRDLYQPLPLLSFSAEFAVAGALGLFETGTQGGAWLFHLTNVVLHAVNAVLVWFLIALLQQGTRRDRAAPGSSARVFPSAAEWTATVAAILFAIHPLQMEVIAWLNGRMMLLSTLFALASMIAFARWLSGRPTVGGETAVGSRRTGLVVLTIVLVLLSAISKVRVGLPILLLIVAFALRARPTRRVVLLWLTCSVVTGVFALINVLATSEADLFAQGAEHLQGSRVVRVLLSVDFYFHHLAWPTGLGSYYPTPPMVTWSDAGTIRAIAVVLAGLGLLGWACLRRTEALLGVVWFFATLASTLPFFPARNILAADRYMYLPIIGLCWLVASLGCSIHRRYVQTRAASSALPWLMGTAAVALAAVLIGMSWHVGRFYETPILKTRRTASLFPDTPRVWEPLGWTLFGEDDFAGAIECADMELRHDSPNVRSGAYQLKGMSEIGLGNVETGLSHLHKAIEADTDNLLAQYRLGLALDDLGRLDDAIRSYEEAVGTSSLHNPTITRLASAYRRAGRPSDARAMYERAVSNNPYEVNGLLGIAELDMAVGTKEAFLTAERRLVELLDWMPENTQARTNLGAVRHALGRTAEAISSYLDVLHRDRLHVTASLNLAQIYASRGEMKRAARLFRVAAEGGLESVEQGLVVHDFFVSRGDLADAVALWERMAERFTDSLEVRALAAWSRAMSGDLTGAAVFMENLRGQEVQSPLVMAAVAYMNLATERYREAAKHTASLCAVGERGSSERRRLQLALEFFDQAKPDIPWTFCLAARLLIAEGNERGAGLFIDLCAERCGDPACRTETETLRSRLNAPSHLP